jgi:hypothetical protein
VEVVLEIAKKLGKYEKVTKGKTVEEWIQYCFDQMELRNIFPGKIFQKKQYYVFNVDKDWDKSRLV